MLTQMDERKCIYKRSMFVRWYFYITQLLIVHCNNATIFVTNIKNITAILT